MTDHTDALAPQCRTLDARKALLERFGGLPETTVQNTEWLYMLEQDTRHSLAIEGYFASEDELEAVLQGRRSNREITNYFRTAQTLYDQGLQYYRDKALRLDLSLIRHIHSELFRESDERRRGQFRTGGVQILRAKVQPPEFDIESYLRVALDTMEAELGQEPSLAALARTHALFESIHPFHDGNGRAGRILLNYLALSKGYPPIVIKGVTADERERYYAALEAADVGFHSGFPEPTAAALSQRLSMGAFEPLMLLLCEGVLPRLNRLTALALERHERLLSLPELAARLGVKESALRKRIERGTLLAVRRGKRVYSHPLLSLGAL